MTTLIEAARQALEALERYAPQHGHPDDMSEAITALRTAIAEAEKQEPVAWMFTDVEGTEFFEEREDWKGKWTPLYTTPPAAQREWVGLTDEQINQYDYQYRDLLYDAEKMLRENNA